MSQYDPRDFYEPGNQAGNQQGSQPDPEDARYMPRDLRVEPREYQRGTSRPNPDARPRTQRRLLAPVLAVVGLMVFFAIVWFAWSSSQPTVGEGGMPVVKADNSPVKMRPEQPGGMAVPHQDKLIYDRLKAETGNTETAAVERLLPPPENPLPRPEAPPPPEAIEEPATSGLPPSAMETPPMPGNGVPEAPASQPVPPVAVTPVPAPAPAPSPAAPPPAVAARPTPPPPQAAPAAPPRSLTPPTAPAQTAALPPPPAPPAASSGGGNFRLQIASVKSEDAARAEFQRLQKRYPEALGGLGVAYVRVDLGDKGIYYRVQAGPVDEARATSICSSLKSQSVGCILVRQ